MWALGASGVDRIDPATGEVTDTFSAGGFANALAVTPEAVWVVADNREVRRLDPESGETVGDLTEVPDAASIAVDERYAWVASPSGAVTRIDVNSMAVVGDPVEVPDAVDVAVGAGGVWVAGAGGEVTRLDPRSGAAVGEPIEVGRQPVSISASGKFVWVANAGGATVTRIAPYVAAVALELDLANHLRGSAGCDHPRGDVARYDRVRADRAALADLDAPRHHATDPEPAVGADPHRPARDEALFGDRLVGIVVAVVRVADEAVVGEHHVVADLDPLGGREHRVLVEKAAVPDLDLRARAQGQPAPRLQQGPLPYPQPPLVEGLEHLTLHGKADEGPRARHVAVDAKAA